jgi:hypothetical protein
MEGGEGRRRRTKNQSEEPCFSGRGIPAFSRKPKTREERGEMARIRLAFMVSLMVMLVASSLFPASVDAQKKLYISGTQSLTGPYAED